ncbi:heat shock protein DnaJ domain protein [Thiorhodococcus drewsii AZ1]|uniref:Heat shock protein DnaJ domain protein n=1 Tax=Thiorhodococcus drewsii AZ1 TaxID=765913 RepID=G2DXA2_9GAMM|nr:co-chaperone DjlA [Thiorhodococcus drewsii]EGV33456.1 heat shock protein DnaJ domain protein [Thiorhodococcus drewsii AZ1]
MRWLGTAAGGALGLLFGGPVGALFGAILGQGVDRGLAGGYLRADLSTEQRGRIQERFFEAVFSLLGHLAKADGRVSEAEIAYAESVMDRMDLSPALRRTAIDLFTQGKSAQFDCFAMVEGLSRSCSGQHALLRLLLEILLGMAYVESAPTREQRDLLDRVRRALKVSSFEFKGLEHLVMLQRRVRSSAGRGGGDERATDEAPRAHPLSESYATLGIEPESSVPEIKRAYRRLLSQHHPDKLASRGLPEEALHIAARKTHEIRRAYEEIAQARGF